MDTLVDYSPTIRAEIEREVERLKTRLENVEDFDGDWVRVGVVAQYVEMGHLVNTHHGKILYSEGDLICGLPVRLGRCLSRTIRVCADNVQFIEEVDDFDEDGEPCTHECTYTRDLSEETTW